MSNANDTHNDILKLKEHNKTLHLLMLANVKKHRKLQGFMRM